MLRAVRRALVRTSSSDAAAAAAGTTVSVEVPLPMTPRERTGLLNATAATAFLAARAAVGGLEPNAGFRAASLDASVAIPALLRRGVDASERVVDILGHVLPDDNEQLLMARME